MHRPTAPTVSATIRYKQPFPIELNAQRAATFPIELRWDMHLGPAKHRLSSTRPTRAVGAGTQHLSSPLSHGCVSAQHIMIPHAPLHYNPNAKQKTHSSTIACLHRAARARHVTIWQARAHPGATFYHRSPAHERTELACWEAWLSAKAFQVPRDSVV